ncbi:unnamed protein product [Cylindrotheca closterium]|uniref:HSF-type DNA-binding domain-containing protein n=1 Tax=Cylindrotheca closterium TaxID=2856 RepID=A0AAD2CND3_9STRA|nr:unnamed protein product [Cylindrotheca closterium]
MTATLTHSNITSQVKSTSSFAPSTSTEDRFTVKLHKLLEDAETQGFQDIIAWNRDGRSFTIYKPVVFAETIMRKYFRQSKYKSFQRQMNLYGFHRGSRNGIRGVYSNPMFIRDDRELSEQMRRKAKGVSKEVSKGGPSSPYMTGIFHPQMFMQTVSPIGNINLQLATLLQPVPININAMRCYSSKSSQDDDEESMGTIEGQILDEEDYIL